jgi:hypothetical protein
MYLSVVADLGDPVRPPGTDIDKAIDRARRRTKTEYALFRRESAKAGGNPADVRKHAREAWWWMNEALFLENLKALYENQSGVPLNYAAYPVTKKDAQGRSSSGTPWRFTPNRQQFSRDEAQGSFCLGSTRSMAFRSLFGLARPSYRDVLAALRAKILSAKANGDTAEEARLLISRIVSHASDPGSRTQFNHDIADRYGIKNAHVIAAGRAEAEKALKSGAPVMADLEGGWHWVMVRRSPRGEMWANDPLYDRSIRRISWPDLGTRFEIIVDSRTGQPITPDKSSEFQR